MQHKGKVRKGSSNDLGRTQNSMIFTVGRETTFKASRATVLIFLEPRQWVMMKSEPGEKERPPGLTGIQTHGQLNILQILVISIDGNPKLGSFLPISLLFCLMGSSYQLPIS